MIKAVVSTTVLELAYTSLDELTQGAFENARSAHGYGVTYSPTVFIPLTKLCRDRCGYCTFYQVATCVATPYMSLEEVMVVAQEELSTGCTEAHFTLGERPELRYDAVARWLAARGYKSTIDYVASAAQMVLESNPASPQSHVGHPVFAGYCKRSTPWAFAALAR